MKLFNSFFVIIFSLIGIFFIEGQSTTKQSIFLGTLSNSSFSVGSESEQLTPLITKAKQLLEQMKEFCIIQNHKILISTKCCEDIKILLVSFIVGKPWAIKMLDSFAKLQSGIMLGNLFNPGQYEECKSVNVNVTPSFTSPKYCQAKVPVYPNKNQKVDFTFGLCVPNSCSAEDCKHLFEEGLHMLPHHLGDRLNATVHCPQKPVWDTKATIAITICLLFCSFILFGTLCDVYFKQIPQSDISTGLPNDEMQDSSNLLIQQITPKKYSVGLKKFFLCFSILKNIEKLLNTKLPDGSLPAVHGIRFLSMAWVILGHSYYFSLTTVGNIISLVDMSGRFTFQVVDMAMYSVDTFFLLSGMLVTYGTLKMLTAKEGKINWLYFYIHRFYRLSPTYFILLMVYICLLKYFGSGPFWYTEFDKGCSKNWWYNLIYSNSYLQNGGCMGWTWYLANDMQFYIISPIMIYLLHKFPKFGLLLTLLLLCVQTIISGVMINLKKIRASSGPTYMSMYMMTYYRIGPFLVGILLGYILHITNCKKTLNKVFVSCMWLMSFAISFALIFGLYKQNGGASLSQPVATLFWTLCHTVWSVCVAWVIFACCSGYGGIINRILSWKVFIPLSRLTYCAYLIHPIVMIVYYLNLLQPTLVTDIVAVYQFLGHLVLSYLFAFFASMIIEAPLLKIEGVFFRKNR